MTHNAGQSVMKESAPAVSVVIPCFNCADFILQTLESVLSQTYKDFEVVVVDDGSTDHTPLVLGTLSDTRIRVIRKANGGSGSARNAGIRAARGSYIAFLDADDLWFRNKLELQMRELARSKAAWIYSDALVLEGDVSRPIGRNSQGRKLYAGEILQPLLFRNFINGSTTIVRRDVFDQVGFFTEQSWHEDWEMWLAIASRHPIACVYQPLAMYRRHPSSKSSTVDLQLSFNRRRTIIENMVSSHPAQLSSIRAKALSTQGILTAMRMLGQKKQFRCQTDSTSDNRMVPKVRQSVCSRVVLPNAEFFNGTGVPHCAKMR